MTVIFADSLAGFFNTRILGQFLSTKFEPRELGANR